MLRKVLRGICTLFGMIIGYVLGNAAIVHRWLPQKMATTDMYRWLVTIGAVVIFGLIFYFIFSLIVKMGKAISKAVEKSLEEVRMADVVLGIGGLVIGLLIAMLISVPIAQIPIKWLASVLTIVVYVLMAYLGVAIPVRKRDEFIDAFRQMRSVNVGSSLTRKLSRRKTNALEPEIKILDTSVIIDGRIYDIMRSGFLEGPVIVPVFVLAELQLLADNGDDLKRARGRRGLDIVKKMQNEFDEMIRVSEEDYDDLTGVDDKLVRMGKEKKYKILTNDYNLNKVATVRGVQVLNINELANAVKPVVLPGEAMQVHPVKNGKESGQAVAYLDDGTMIVVENGKRHIGEHIAVTVTSVLQTAAGRMIFAKPSKDV